MILKLIGLPLPKLFINSTKCDHNSKYINWIMQKLRKWYQNSIKIC